MSVSTQRHTRVTSASLSAELSSHPQVRTPVSFCRLLKTPVRSFLRQTPLLRPDCLLLAKHLTAQCSPTFGHMTKLDCQTAINNYLQFQVEADTSFYLTHLSMSMAIILHV